ncbi:MAG TPA: hypothetical protein VF250_08100 [Conexibacter sp.]
MTRVIRILAMAVGLVAALASVAAAAPALRVTMLSPDHVTAGRSLYIAVAVQNMGTDPLSGSLTVRYTFPAGIVPADPVSEGEDVGLTCQTAGQIVECTGDATGIQPGVQLRLRTTTTVDPGATGSAAGRIDVEGGGDSNAYSEPFSITVGPSGPFAINGFDVVMSDALTVPAARAGSDPTELSTTVRMLSEAQSNLDLSSENFQVTSPTESFRDVTVHVPPGFVGNPLATPARCTHSQLTTPVTFTVIPTCPPESQIGLVQINGANDIVPLFNIVPPTGFPAEFGFFYNSIVVTLVARVRPFDNGIDIVTQKAPNSIPIPKFQVTMWGVPTDPSHDRLRSVCLQGGFGWNSTKGDCSLSTRNDVPFLRTPTSCPGTPLVWGIDMNTYQHPTRLVHSETTTPPIEGCQYSNDAFDPSFALAPSTSAPRAVSGVDATVLLGQDWSVTGIAPADLRRASVTLPEGLTINPSSADGLGACTDAQLGLRQEGPARCPDASKLGTVTLRTPLLDHEVGGSIYLRTQNSDDPLSGELFRIAVEIRSDRDGIFIKLPGSIQPNPVRDVPQTGQLTTVFDNLPQLPFESMTLHFKQGPRAPLSTPDVCGTHTTTADLLSWGDAPRHIDASFVTRGCKTLRFEPTFRAGVEQPVAGSSSPFHLSLSRTDDDEEFSGLTVNTPRGLLARVKDAVQCSNTAADRDECPAGSLIGHAKVAAGIGTNPFWVTNGRVYLTEPHRGAPYGLAVAVDAIAGPFDLGTVIVRQAIHVDPRTAELRVVSDPFPTSVKGVPLHIRTVRVSIDKPRFMVSPTNCSTLQTTAVATGAHDRTAELSSRFKVGSCKNLAFSPKLSLFVGDNGRTSQQGISTPFRAVLTQKPGQSNLRSVRVQLPGTLAALLDVVQRACSLAEYQDGRCRGSEAGSAVARTPLLKDPLKGGVFFVRHPGRPLPDLMVALRGDIDIDLVGRVTVVDSKYLETNFDTIPDAPVSKFTLNIVAGTHGPLGIVTNLCSRRGQRSTAIVQMRGQNGDAITRHTRLHIRGCGGKRR